MRHRYTLSLLLVGLLILSWLAWSGPATTAGPAGLEPARSPLVRTPSVREFNSRSPVGGRAQGPAGCAELLTNGDFEAGASGWAQSSAGGYNLISNFNPRTGKLGAYLGGYNNANDQLSQVVALPADGSSLTLRLWWSLTTQETAGTFDFMAVALGRPDGSLLAELTRIDNTRPADLWTQADFDLDAYAGQTVVVRFTARTDATNPTHFFVDDVSLAACPPVTPTVTSTPTASSTPLATATPTMTPTATPARGTPGYLPYISKGGN